MTAHDLDAALKQAWAVAGQNPNAAIAILAAVQEHPAFYPWGAHTLLDCLCHVGRKAEARALAAEIGRHAPAFYASWWMRIVLAYGTEGYQELCDQLAEAFRSLAPDDATKLATPFIATILTARPADWQSLMQRLFLDPGTIGARDADCIAKAVDFLAAVARLKADQHGGGRPQGWRLALCGIGPCGSQPALATDAEGIATVNLSLLGVDRLEGWGAGLAERVVVAIAAIMGWAPYVDDRGASSWRTVSDADRFAAVFWRLVAAPLEWLDLGPVGADAPAVRPVGFAGAGLGQGRGRLFVRPGNVEIWALWSALHDPAAAAAAAEQVAARALEASARGARPVTFNERPWVDPVQNIARLNTNAGWYARPGRAADAFRDWAARYGAALCEGQILKSHDIELLPIAAMLPALRRQRPGEWADADLLGLIDDTHVVFVTAYHAEIRAHYQAGKLAALWAELATGTTVRSLTTIAAPMSVWPYYPHDSWSESFRLLCAESARAIDPTQPTVFIASCGCYGLPLVHEMHRRFKVTAVYCGQDSNVCFGVLSGAARNSGLFRRNRDAVNWLVPDLAERFPQVAWIDDGRYVRPKP